MILLGIWSDCSATVGRVGRDGPVRQQDPCGSINAGPSQPWKATCGRSPDNEPATLHNL